MFGRRPPCATESSHGTRLGVSDIRLRPGCALRRAAHPRSRRVGRRAGGGDAVSRRLPGAGRAARLYRPRRGGTSDVPSGVRDEAVRVVEAPVTCALTQGSRGTQLTTRRGASGVSGTPRSPCPSRASRTPMPCRGAEPPSLTCRPGAPPEPCREASCRSGTAVPAQGE